MSGRKLFKIVITAIVVRDDKFLLIQLPADHKKFPSRWSVPGGKFETSDYTEFPKDTPNYWYNVLERALKREVREEVGLEVKNIRYVTSLADAREDDDPSVVISCLADYVAGDVTLEAGMQGHRWVTLAEAKEVDPIEGIYQELEMADKALKGEKSEWQGQ